MSEEYIVITESSRYAQESLSIYQALGNLICIEGEKSQIDAHLDKATVLVVRLGVYLNSDFLRKALRLKYIVSPTTGHNHIDLDFCKQKGIEVLSLKGEKEFLKKITATSEHTIGLMIALIRGILGSHLDIIKDNKWDRNKFCGRDLSALRLGIMGFGRVGQIVAQFAKALGMLICAYAPNVSEECYTKMGVDEVQPDQLFTSSDVVSVHMDYEKGRENLIGPKHFSLMKSGSYFINTSRGELVDEAALVEALESGKLAGAAVDVLQNEHDQKLLFESPIIKYAQKNNNLIITPHIGGCTLDSMHKTEIFMAKKLCEEIKVNSSI